MLLCHFVAAAAASTIVWSSAAPDTIVAGATPENITFVFTPTVALSAASNDTISITASAVIWSGVTSCSASGLAAASFTPSGSLTGLTLALADDTSDEFAANNTVTVTCTGGLAANGNAAVTFDVVSTKDTAPHATPQTGYAIETKIVWISATPSTLVVGTIPSRIVFIIALTKALSAGKKIAITSSAAIWSGAASSCAAIGLNAAATSPRIAGTMQVITLAPGDALAAGTVATITCTGGLLVHPNSATPITFSAFTSTDAAQITAQIGYRISTRIGWGSATLLGTASYVTPASFPGIQGGVGGTIETSDAGANSSIFTIFNMKLFYTFEITASGANYSSNATMGDLMADKIVVLGTSLGGTSPANDATLTVTSTASATDLSTANVAITGTPVQLGGQPEGVVFKVTPTHSIAATDYAITLTASKGLWGVADATSVTCTCTTVGATNITVRNTTASRLNTSDSFGDTLTIATHAFSASSSESEELTFTCLGGMRRNPIEPSTVTFSASSTTDVERVTAQVGFNTFAKDSIVWTSAIPTSRAAGVAPESINFAFTTTKALIGRNSSFAGIQGGVRGTVETSVGGANSAIFTIHNKGSGLYTFNITTPGSGYNSTNATGDGVADKIVIKGSTLGGVDGANDCTLTVTGAAGTGALSFDSGVIVTGTPVDSRVSITITASTAIWMSTTTCAGEGVASVRITPNANNMAVVIPLVAGGAIPAGTAASITCTGGLAPHANSATPITFDIVSTADTVPSTGQHGYTIETQLGWTMSSAVPQSRSAGLTPTNIIFKVTPFTAVKEQDVFTLTASAGIWSTADATSVACTCMGASFVAVMSVTTSQTTLLADTIAIQVGDASAANQELTFTCIGGLQANENTAAAITFAAVSTTNPTAIVAQSGYSIKTKIGWGSVVVPTLVAGEIASQIMFNVTPTRAVSLNNTITLTASKPLWAYDISNNTITLRSVNCTCIGAAAASVAVMSSTTSQTTSLADTITIRMGAGSAAGVQLSFICVGGLKANSNTAGALTFTAKSTTDETAITAQTGFAVQTKIGWMSVTMQSVAAFTTPSNITFVITPTNAITGGDSITFTSKTRDTVSAGIWKSTGNTCSCTGATALAVANSTTSQTLTTGTAYDTLTVVLANSSQAGQTLTITCEGGLSEIENSIYPVTFDAVSTSDVTPRRGNSGFSIATQMNFTSATVENNVAQEIASYVVFEVTPLRTLEEMTDFLIFTASIPIWNSSSSTTTRCAAANTTFTNSTVVVSSTPRRFSTVVVSSTTIQIFLVVNDTMPRGELVKIKCENGLLRNPSHGTVTFIAKTSRDTTPTTPFTGHVIATLEPSAAPTSAPTAVPTTAPTTAVPSSAPTQTPTAAPSAAPTASCATLIAPTHGNTPILSNANVHGSTATFTCSAGYVLMGASTILCTSSAWTPSAPTCNPAQCVGLVAPLRGYFTYSSTSFAYDDSNPTTATYLCFPGFTISAATTRTCNVVGVGSVTWTSEMAPTCDTSTPTTAPSTGPTHAPTSTPTHVPTHMPTSAPTTAPSTAPSEVPTSMPSSAPTSVPSAAPSEVPTSTPSTAPTHTPTSLPTAAPTQTPTFSPSVSPTLLGYRFPQVQAMVRLVGLTEAQFNVGTPARAAFVSAAAQRMETSIYEIVIVDVRQVMVDSKLLRRRLAELDDGKTETLEVKFIVKGMDQLENGGMLAKRLYDVLQNTSASGFSMMFDDAVPSTTVTMKVLAYPSVHGVAPPPPGDLGLFGDSDKAAALIFIGIFIVCPIFVLILIPLLGIASVAVYVWYRAFTLRRNPSVFEKTDDEEEASKLGGIKDMMREASKKIINIQLNRLGKEEDSSSSNSSSDADEFVDHDDDDGHKHKVDKQAAAAKEKEIALLKAQVAELKDKSVKHDHATFIASFSDTRKPHLTREASQSPRKGKAVSPRRMMGATKMGNSPRTTKRLELRAEMRAKRQARRKKEASTGRAIKRGDAIASTAADELELEQLRVLRGARAQKTPRRASLIALAGGGDVEHHRMVAEFLSHRLNVAVGGDAPIAPITEKKIDSSEGSDDAQGSAAATRGATESTNAESTLKTQQSKLREEQEQLVTQRAEMEAERLVLRQREHEVERKKQLAELAVHRAAALKAREAVEAQRLLLKEQHAKLLQQHTDIHVAEAAAHHKGGQEMEMDTSSEEEEEDVVEVSVDDAASEKTDEDY